MYLLDFTDNVCYKIITEIQRNKMVILKVKDDLLFKYMLAKL